MPEGAEILVGNGRKLARWTHAKNQVRPPMCSRMAAPEARDRRRENDL